MTNNGTETEDSAASADCHRITTTEFSLEETPVHSFAQQVHYKEVMNPFAVKKMFELDFLECESHEKVMSQEDRRFVQRMKDGIHLIEDRHYEIPLLFQQDKVELPSNQKAAEIRLSQVKRYFAKDS